VLRRCASAAEKARLWQLRLSNKFRLHLIPIPSPRA
jgi:hypothetical protein